MIFLLLKRRMNSKPWDSSFNYEILREFYVLSQVTKAFMRQPPEHFFTTCRFPPFVPI